MLTNNPQREIAAKFHADRNNLYDGGPYVYHLDMCVEFCQMFRDLVPAKSYTDIESGVYHHDTIEDCCVTYNDLKKVSNCNVAEISLALQNNPGRTRAERANAAYYARIRECPFPYADYAKICDRMANMKHSKETGSRQHKMYVNEYDHFYNELYTPKYENMFLYIEQVLM